MATQLTCQNQILIFTVKAEHLKGKHGTELKNPEGGGGGWRLWMGDYMDIFWNNTLEFLNYIVFACMIMPLYKPLWADFFLLYLLRQCALVCIVHLFTLFT